MVQRNKTYCRSCTAPIWWGVTFAGKNMPLDWAASDDGGWVMDGRTDLGAPAVRQLAPLLDPPEIERFTPHWATCPNADQHRAANGNVAQGMDTGK